LARFPYYERLTARQQAIYRKSDAIVTVPIPAGEALDPVVTEIRDGLEAGDQARTQLACQRLSDALTRRFAVPPVRIAVLATRPVLRSGDDLYGLYEPADGVHPTTISVWMRTSQRKKVVAFRTFLRTLIHELCHHLDYELFNLDETFHTAGFYQRESSLIRQLLAL
jgi:hypothetical protein